MSLKQKGMPSADPPRQSKVKKWAMDDGARLAGCWLAGWLAASAGGRGPFRGLATRGKKRGECLTGRGRGSGCEKRKAARKKREGSGLLGVQN